MNAIVGIVIVGLIFINSIPSIEDLNELAANSQNVQPLRLKFIEIQGVSFINIVSCLMTGLFSVSLSCNTFLLYLF